MTAAERNQRARERIRGQGGAVVQIFLSRPAQRALGRLSAGSSKREVIERLLLAASPPDVEAEPADWLDTATRGR